MEADVYTHKGWYRAAVPSGASTGVYEAVELRDGGNKYSLTGVDRASRHQLAVLELTLLPLALCRWTGKGVSKAVGNINDIIAPGLLVSL